MPIPCLRASVVILSYFLSSLSLAAEPKLLIAFSSYRERPKHPQIYYYEHDGKSDGKIIEKIPTVELRSDNRASLSLDGRYCAFAAEMENETSRIFLWDRQDKKLVDLPTINDSPNALLWPTMSGDAKTIIFAGWNRPNATQRWDLFSYNVPDKRTAFLSELNTSLFDERMPAISASGQWLFYVTNDKSGAGVADIACFDLKSATPSPLKGLNTEHREVEPSASADGRLLAFVSDRPGGSGGRDIYLFDRQTSSLLELPGLNSVAHEQTPSLSPDGRYIAFVSERIKGAGERDIYLYDRAQNSLLPTPNLNARQEDIDPCILVLQEP